MKKNNVFIIALFIILLLGAIAYFMFINKQDGMVIKTNQIPITSGENPQPGSSIHDLPVEPAAAKARKDLAAKLYIEEKNIVIMQITETAWNDSCLGLGGIAESCLQALIPGFKVEMIANEKTYIYRTDKVGDIIRSEK